MNPPPADPSASTPALTTPHHDDTPALLSWTSFGICLAITLVIFTVIHPVWEPLDMDQMNANIWWSYAPIPLLALVFLAFERKLSGSALFLETLRLTFAKFAITFTVSHVLWSVIPPPGVPESTAPPTATKPAKGDFFVREPLTPTSIDPATTGGLSGSVTDAAGAPLAGVLVFVSSGLDEYVFAAPTEPVELVNAGAGFAPAFAVVRCYQPLTLRNTDDVLHTAITAGRDDRPVFHYPVVAGGERQVMFKRHLGLISLGCKAHGDAEPTGRLAVIGNPFVAFTDAAGRFQWDGIPAGEIELSAWSTSAGETRSSLAVRAGTRAPVELELP